ncbi:ferrichrome siderophore peptide synthetase [Fusarium heterosporum]|uniref:Ferrichrome siderophore peptide synthetase n=1 Tax=Fusarium heterosporum TaxID=42747 RepID=A0A8H5WNY8_FUSHE|nr:ferrichrome siderophore peptide synthetase [Fusarium heterosporum]
MDNASRSTMPPVTQLRPLHTYQQATDAASKTDARLEPEQLNWVSSIQPHPGHETALKAFVKLVSCLIILDEDESFCIQDSSRGGYILARYSSHGKNAVGDFCFIESQNYRDIPTDFSIGSGKTLQLHVGAEGEVQLTAIVNAIPRPALDALGCMLDDIISSLLNAESGSVGWSQPSVLNFPPRIRPVPLLRQDESTQQGPGSEDAQASLLHSWFDQRVVESPHSIAIDYLEDLKSNARTRLTYRQVSNAVTKLAAKVLEVSATSPQPLKTVAVLIGPCPELYISYLAALKAGVAFCPIDVDAPRERKESLMADLKPSVVLTTRSLMESDLWSSLAPIPVEALDVTPYLAACDSDTDTLSPLTTVIEDSVAYVLYTSGTTGLPKGVAVSHLSATCTISSLSAHYGFTLPPPGSKPVRWFQGAAPTFDISLFEIFWTLSTGSTLCCAPRELTLQDIDKVVTTMEADITNITPSFANLLEPSSIRGLMVGGETLNTRILRDFAQGNPAVEDVKSHVPRGIFNGYGPTETAIYSIAQAHVPENQRGSVIGSPLATCGVLIVEYQSRSQECEYLQPVPMGALGELVITGPQVSRVGYLNRPEESLKAFIDDPRWDRAYKTGDRARIVWDVSGSPIVEFLGRISSEQVKLSGRRVELGEIESVLSSKVAAVKETLACVWKHGVETGSEKVISLIVVDTRLGLDFDAVHQRCEEAVQKYLPEYMRPFKILSVEAIPKSASGKADRKAALGIIGGVLGRDSISSQQTTTQDHAAQEVEPLAESEDVKIECELVSIIQNVLNDGSPYRPTIRADTALIEAGIDSLRGMRILRDIRKQWPMSEPSSDVGKLARLQPSLALLLDAKATIRSVFFPEQEDLDGPNTPASREADAKARIEDFGTRHLPEARSKLKVTSGSDIEVVLPATSTQSQLALSFAIDKRNYISHTVLRLRSDVSASVLKNNIEAVLSRQAIYRCVILPCDDSLSPFLQVVLSPDAWNRFVGTSSRVVYRKVDSPDVNVQAALDQALDNLNLESQKLYYIQIIEPQDSSSDGILIISAAHCICDGPSLEVLMSDISREYVGLTPLPRQGIYDSVLEWASNVSPETDQLWQKALQGWETEPLGAISGNNIKPSASVAVQQHAMVQHESGIPWHVLESKGRSLGASPLTILQAAWATLLHNMSEADTDDVTFGSVLSGHDHFVHAPTFSVVPCRVALPEMQTLRQLLGSLMEHSRLAQSHRHTSFGVFKTLPYNTALALQAYQTPDHVDEHACDVLWTEKSNPAIRYDFVMFAEVFTTDPRPSDRNGKSGDVFFKLTYRDETFSQLSASCIVKQFASVTKAILSSLPDDIVQALPARIDRALLSAEGTIPVDEHIVDVPTRNVRDRSRLLHSQFEDQAASTPDLLALSFHSSLDTPPIELSYAELDARANGLARILREQDVDIIPICLERGTELYVSVLAILKAGSAWCPIDTTSPVQRRTSLIARAQSKVLLTTTESLPLVEPCLAQDALKNVQVILVDQYAHCRSFERAKPRDSISPEITGQDLAYLLWTSGTTGEPKGVMIQHSAAAQAMRDLRVLVEHDENEQVRTLQLSAYSFDVFVQDLFYTWGLAGSVISGTRELVLGTFTEFIWKSRPTHAHLTPSFGASIAVQELKGSTLQYVTFIGEKLTEDVAEAWASPEITTRAYNTYGPAENAVVSTMRRFYGKSRDAAKAANVGFPLDHCTAYVVREVAIGQDAKQWELVPRYGVGELALGGAQVGKGYLSNEAKTKKAFIQGGPGIEERIYLTGDLVRLNDHGFEFLGRNDDLVKITGIRIELSEISAAVASLKDDEAAIEHVETLYLQRPSATAGNNNKVVVTFVSVKTGNVNTSKIRSQVFKRAKDLLPAYMVPGHVVILDTTMPRTASNKVDRKALQAIYAASDLNVLAGRNAAALFTDDARQHEQRWTPQQLMTLELIAANFNILTKNLSPEDSLAGLGLSSLQVTKLAWLLRRELQCQVGVVDLIKCESLGELVDVTLSRMPEVPVTEGQSSEEKLQEGQSWFASIKDTLTKNIIGNMRPDDTQYILPATPMQESLIVETMLEPQAYWAHRVFDLSQLDEVDDRQLKRAWVATAKRCDILRTIFVPLTQLDVDDSKDTVSWARQKGIQSAILQLVRDKPAVRWTQIHSEEDQSLSELARRVQLELSPATTTEPPWAVTFVDHSRKMMLSMHHSLYDATASEIILETVSRLYHMEAISDLSELSQFGKGLELGLLPLPEKRDEAAALWSRRLEDLSKGTSGGNINAPFPDLTQSRQKQVQKILLSRKEISSSLLETTSTVALPTLLQSAFGCVLASYLELESIVLGHTVSQRVLHPDLAQVVGPAIATLPLVVRTNASSAVELWKEMSHDSAQLFQASHNLHPVDAKKMLNRGSGSSNAPFPGLFVYHPAPEDDQVGTTQHMFREIGQALSLNVEHPLALNVFEADGMVELTGDGRRIAQAQLDLLLSQVLDQARVMAESPSTPLPQLQNKMNRCFLSTSGETCLEKMGPNNPTDSVALHASQHPDWIAAEQITFQSSEGEDMTTKTITYGQLNELANNILHQLVQHEANLQPDDPVAMCLGRDIMSLAVTIAIFRAGFVYLPVDEELPSARKQLLIRDAGAKLVITTEELAEDLDIKSSDDLPLLIISSEVEVRNFTSALSGPVPQCHNPGDGGYLLYTSGSTGRPKGVRVSNSNLCHFISAFSQRMIEYSPTTARLGGIGKYLNLTSRAFDPHLTQLFVPWYLGHRVVIGADRTAMLANLKELINELSITHFGSVPSVLTQLRLRPKDVPSVRVVTTGGEKASNELLNTWAQTSDRDSCGDKAVLFNFYGPTEVTIGCLGHPVNSESNARNLGLPLQGLEAILLCPNTREGELVIARRGQPGELCIAGPQVAMGYLNRPIEQAKSFQTISVLGNSKTVYRTGDMMRMMKDGSLEFLGRADQQTKIRGQRLELGEVVTFLKQAAGDDDDLDFAATVTSSGDDGSSQQQQLLAFIARKSGDPKLNANVDSQLFQALDENSASLLESIELQCQSKLPAFMVPTLLWVTKIPYLAASGKVDTKVLARLAKDFLDTQGDQDHDACNDITVGSSPLLNSNELVVVRAIEQVVGSDIKATPASTIHRLGIDSLSAVNLLSLLRKRGFSSLKMTHILSSSCTVGSIARHADHYTDSSSSSTLPPTPTSTNNDQTPMGKITALTTNDLGPLPEGLHEENIEAVLPCLPLQSALIARSLVWLSAYEDTHGAAEHNVPYVAHFSYRLGRGTDILRWKKTAEDVINSEAMLRTCFLQREDGQIFQVVLRSPSISPLSDERHADIVKCMNTRPPVRLEVMETTNNQGAVATLKIHHALFDGVAISALKQKLEKSYNTHYSQNDTLELLKNVSSHCALSNDQMESTKRSWQAQLNGFQPCHVRTRDYNTTDAAMVRSTFCLEYSTSELNTMFRSQSSESRDPISISSAFQLATSLCLAQLTQQRSILYGFVMSLRPLLEHMTDEINTFVGPCLNTLIKTTVLQDDDETLPDLAQRVHKAHMDVCQSTMPLVSVDKVQRWSGCEDKLFDSLLSINSSSPTKGDDDTNRPGHMIALPTRSSSDMALAIDVDLHQDGKILLTLSSAAALSQKQLDDVGRLFEKIVFNCADENAKVSNIISLPPKVQNVALCANTGSNVGNTEMHVTDQGYQKALFDVQTTIGRLLRLDQSEVSSKPLSTSFYQLGLDSITILPFVKVINKSNKTKLSSHAVIKARTIRGVAELLAGARAKQESQITSDGASLVKRQDGRDILNDADTYDKTLDRLARDLMFIATPLQEGMLSASLATGGEAYTYTHAIQLSEAALRADTPDLDRFFTAINDTVRCCEILRTSFIFTEDDEAPWVGIVSPIEQSNLVSWKVEPSVPGRVHLRIHHALYDATSIQAIWRILEDNYHSRLHKETSHRHGESKHVFRPFAKVVSSSQRSSVAFWTKALQGYTYTPLDFPNRELKASASFHFTIEDHKLSLLQSKCKNLGVTIKAALQLSWVKVLCESLYNQADIVYGEVVSSDADDDKAIAGPAINTVPMRIRLGDSNHILSVAEALILVQEEIDSARGSNSMASLRKVQTEWRSSQPRDAPAGLFQSLFVFDGVIGSSHTSNTPSVLFKPVQAEAADAAGPAYDEYPIIVNFNIKNNVLNGKLRAKMPSNDVVNLGNKLVASLDHIINQPEMPVLNKNYLSAPGKTNKQARPAVTLVEPPMEGMKSAADAVLEIVKEIMGTRRGSKIGYDSRLIGVGIDSILAIRLSKLLRDKIGLDVSVFDIMKGASIRDIVTRRATGLKTPSKEVTQRATALDQRLQASVAKTLDLQENLIQSILPVLSGQRSHLEQWVHNGKRFFEPPWVYRVDDSVSMDKLEASWAELVRVHDILRTTFVYDKSSTNLYQITLNERWPAGKHFTPVLNNSATIEVLIAEHVKKGNASVSDLKEPPARISFLDASDGKAVVLRLHHALYDAWSIKMIERDFNDLLSFGKVQKVRPSLGHEVQRIRDIRQPDAESVYWESHLLHAQETVLGDTVGSVSPHSPGPYFKASYANIVPQAIVKSLSQKSNSQTSAAIILAYAKTLKHFTQQTRPVFGLNHASRSLSSPDGVQTLDLTDASIPSLTITPISANLELSDDEALDLIQEHFAQLTCFAQADGLSKRCPKFNSYVNIIHREASAKVKSFEGQGSGKALTKYKLPEPLASSYFTVAEPSSTVSTIDQLDINHLPSHRFYFNVIIDQSQGVTVTVSGDEALFGRDNEVVNSLVSKFGSEFIDVMGMKN